ncbi:hypothetical protein [Actinomadura sp. 7K507]|uniref:hypothetical protein n=1 Tax=Actinomadura sp. 7K507 TaxID=2530365 RepID=UPI001045196A|nr:hypothetical protein [Actinomadura sp. 7K507]TDC76958.1 hypothetical protein E1285_39320 [Actinomadura sp. 7K507]
MAHTTPPRWRDIATDLIRRIEPRLPDENEKRFFGLGDSAAGLVLETIRTAYSPEGTAFRLTVTVWPADRTRLHYNDGPGSRRRPQNPWPETP